MKIIMCGTPLDDNFIRLLCCISQDISIRSNYMFTHLKTFHTCHFTDYRMERGRHNERRAVITVKGFKSIMIRNERRYERVLIRNTF